MSVVEKSGVKPEASLFRWRDTKCCAILKSSMSFLSSNTTKNRSKRDMMGGEMSMLNLSDLLLSYLPMIGLAAARIEVLAFKVA